MSLFKYAFPSRTEEDAELARQYDREEQLAKQRERLRQEALDQVNDVFKDCLSNHIL